MNSRIARFVYILAAGSIYDTKDTYNQYRLSQYRRMQSGLCIMYTVCLLVCIQMEVLCMKTQNIGACVQVLNQIVFFIELISHWNKLSKIFIFTYCISKVVIKGMCKYFFLL